LENILQTIKRDEISSVILPDGIGGLIEVERLLLTEYGILVIETYPLVGHLFGAEHIDQWTQIVDGRSYKFANPSRHIQNVKHAVQQLAPKLPVFTKVIFTAEGEFPKGMPDGISLITTLEQDLQDIVKSPKIAEQAQVAWDRILRIARKNGQAVTRKGE
jgi:hypothetical protein